MYLIDHTYFTRGNLKIPNINEMQSDSKNVLDDLILEKVCEVLIGALGIENFEDLDSQIVNGVFEPSADQRWLDLVNGVTYDGKKWNGLLYSIGGVKKSLLANYVFYYYLSEDSPSYTIMGMSKQQGKNVLNVSNMPKLVKAWNGFVEEYQGSRSGGLPRATHRGSLTYVDFLGGISERNDGQVTLMRYLSDHSDLYPSTSRWHYPLANRFDL